MNVGEVAFALMQPSNALFALLGAGVLLLFVARRLGTAIVTLAAVLLGGAGLLPLGQAMLRPLEARFPFDPAVDAPDGVVILGGYIGAELSPAPADIALNDKAERLTMAAVLARRWPDAAIILTDGTVDPARPSGAQSSADALDGMGVARSRMVLETRALSTFDNAVFTRRIVEPTAGETYVLVTSAWHMPRSVATFRAAGWPGIVPFPVDYVTDRKPLARAFPGSLAEGLQLVDLAAREHLATLAYRFAGRLDTPASAR